MASPTRSRSPPKAFTNSSKEQLSAYSSSPVLQDIRTAGWQMTNGKWKFQEWRILHFSENKSRFAWIYNFNRNEGRAKLSSMRLIPQIMGYKISTQKHNRSTYKQSLLKVIERSGSRTSATNRRLCQRSLLKHLVQVHLKRWLKTNETAGNINSTLVFRQNAHHLL